MVSKGLNESIVTRHRVINKCCEDSFFFFLIVRTNNLTIRVYWIILIKTRFSLSTGTQKEFLRFIRRTQTTSRGSIESRIKPMTSKYGVYSLCVSLVNSTLFFETQNRCRCFFFIETFIYISVCYFT